METAFPHILQTRPPAPLDGFWPTYSVLLSQFEEHRRIAFTAAQRTLCARTLHETLGEHGFHASAFVNMGTGRGKTFVLLLVLWVYHTLCGSSLGARRFRVLFLCDAARLTEVCAELRNLGLRVFGIGEFNLTRPALLKTVDLERMMESVQVLVLPFSQFNKDLQLGEDVFQPQYTGTEHAHDLKSATGRMDRIMDSLRVPEERRQRVHQELRGLSSSVLQASRDPVSIASIYRRALGVLLNGERHLPLEAFSGPRSGELRANYWELLVLAQTARMSYGDLVVDSFFPSLVCSEELFRTKAMWRCADALDKAGVHSIVGTAADVTNPKMWRSDFEICTARRITSGDDVAEPTMRFLSGLEFEKNQLARDYSVTWASTCASATGCIRMLFDAVFGRFRCDLHDIWCHERISDTRYVRVSEPNIPPLDESFGLRVRLIEDLLDRVGPILGFKWRAYRIDPNMRVYTFRGLRSPAKKQIDAWIESGYAPEHCPFAAAYRNQIHSATRSILAEARRRSIVGVISARGFFDSGGLLSHFMRTPAFVHTDAGHKGARELFRMARMEQVRLDPLSPPEAARRMEELPPLYRLLFVANIASNIVHHFFSGTVRIADPYRQTYSACCRTSSSGIPKILSDVAKRDGFERRMSHSRAEDMPKGCYLLSFADFDLAGIFRAPGKDTETIFEALLDYVRKRSKHAGRRWVPTVVCVPKLLTRGSNTLSRNRLSIMALCHPVFSIAAEASEEIQQCVGRVSRIRDVFGPTDCIGATVVSMVDHFLPSKVLWEVRDTLRDYVFGVWPTLMIDTFFTRPTDSWSAILQIRQLLRGHGPSEEMSSSRRIQSDETAHTRCWTPEQPCPQEHDEALEVFRGPANDEDHPFHEECPFYDVLFFAQYRWARAERKSVEAIPWSKIAMDSVFWKRKEVVTDDDCPVACAHRKAQKWADGLLTKPTEEEQIRAIESRIRRMEDRVFRDEFPWTEKPAAEPITGKKRLAESVLEK